MKIKAEEVRGKRINSASFENFEIDLTKQITTAIKLTISPEANEVRTKDNEAMKINIPEIIPAALSLGPYFLSMLSPQTSMKIKKNGIELFRLAFGMLGRSFEITKQKIAKMKYKLSAYAACKYI